MRHPFALQQDAVLGADVRRTQGELAAKRHGITRVDGKIDDDLLELPHVGLDRPQIAHLPHVKGDILAYQAPEQHRQVGQGFAYVDHLRTHGLLAREGEQLTHQAGGAIGILLDLHDVLEGRIGRPVRIEQEVGRHHDGAQQIVEIVGYVSRQRARWSPSFAAD